MSPTSTPGEAEARLSDLGLVLPAAPQPVANYVPALIAGNLLFISGQISKDASGDVMTGVLGHSATLEHGQKAAHLCALNIIAQAKAALGTLDRVQQ